jgi:glycosyltransferase involved in cell wall biosynthesis
MRTRVLWVVKGLGPGGAERLLVEHARAGDRGRFDYEVAYLLPWKQHLVSELESLGVATHCLGVRSVADPRWIHRLQRLVRARDVAVVHLHSPAVAAPARSALWLRRDRPAVVYTEHNRWPSHHPLTRAANRLTVGLADATIAVSDDVRSSMGRSGDGVAVLTHGIDTSELDALDSRSEVRAELGISDDEVLAVTVANLRATKGYATLLDAARLVVDQGAPIRFVAAGQGPLEAALRQRVVELGLNDRFTMLGYVPEATRLVAAADLFVLASEHEGRPLAVMEALGLGIPVVATSVGGVPDLVEDGTNGLLVPPGSPEALAGAIRELMDPRTRTRLAEGARDRSQSVDGRAAVAHLDALYDDLAARRVARQMHKGRR